MLQMMQKYTQTSESKKLIIIMLTKIYYGPLLVLFMIIYANNILKALNMWLSSARCSSKLKTQYLFTLLYRVISGFFRQRSCAVINDSQYRQDYNFRLSFK